MAAGFFNFPYRTAAARHGATSSHATLPERRKRAAVRAFHEPFSISRCARTRRHAAWHGLRPQRPLGVL